MEFYEYASNMEVGNEDKKKLVEQVFLGSLINGICSINPARQAAENIENFCSYMIQ